MASQHLSFQQCQVVYFCHLCKSAVTYCGPSSRALPVRAGTRASGACLFEDAGVGLIYYGAFPDFMPNDSITAPLSTLERFPAGSQRWDRGWPGACRKISPYYLLKGKVASLPLCSRLVNHHVWEWGRRNLRISKAKPGFNEEIWQCFYFLFPGSLRPLSSGLLLLHWKEWMFIDFPLTLKQWLPFIKHLLCARHCARQFASDPETEPASKCDYAHLIKCQVKAQINQGICPTIPSGQLGFHSRFF